VVSAPIEIVWSLLTDPARWGDFFDVRIIRVEPAGSAVVGQRFYGESGPRFLHIGLKFEYTDVNVAQHKLGLNVQLPFGITVREDLDCIPLSSTRCRVNYHCNFGFAKGWRGAITRTIMRRKLDVGQVDSLSRLKRALRGCRHDDLAKRRQECCAWLLAWLGREELGFRRHGRQPFRPLLITGVDPGSSKAVQVNHGRITL